MSKQRMQPNKNYYNDYDIFDSYDNSYGLDKNQFLLIMRTFNFLMLKSVVDEGKVYSLPPRLGTLSVRKMPFRGKRMIDFNYYKLTGEKKYMKNLHSGGYIAKVH